MQAQAIVTFFVIFVLICCAIATVRPISEASKPCLLGYKAVCSFAPISTAVLSLAAVIVFFVAKSLNAI